MAHYTFELTTAQGSEAVKGSASNAQQVRLDAVRFLAEVLQDEVVAGRVGPVAVRVWRGEALVFEVTCAVEDSGPMGATNDLHEQAGDEAPQSPACRL